MIDESNADRVGIVYGTGIGGIQAWDENTHTLIRRGPDRVSPFLIPMMIGNLAAGTISIELGAKGPSKAVVTACASSANCAGDGMRMIQWGDCDVIVAAGKTS